MKKYISILMVLCSLTWVIAFAHPGRTDSSGGHWVRTEGWGYEVGTYHYHNGGSSSGQSSSSSASSSYSYPFIKETEPKSDEPEEKTYIPTNDIQVSEIPETNAETKPEIKEEDKIDISEFDLSEFNFSEFDLLKNYKLDYNYPTSNKVYEEYYPSNINNSSYTNNLKAFDYFLIILFICICPVIFSCGIYIWAYIKDKCEKKKISASFPSPSKPHPKLNVIDEYQLVQAIKEHLSKKQQALIPEGTAIDENGLPYLVNRQYGYGRLYNAFVTKSGNHYHRSRCPEILGRKKKCIHRYDAIKSYQPCLRCKPLCHVDDWYLEYIEIEKRKNNIRLKKS